MGVTKRVRYFSDLRALACIAIVVFHTYYCAVRLFQPGGAPYVGATVVRNCLLWAVPCFVMVTGALLLNPEKEITIKHIYTRYVRRVLLAILIFTLVFVVFDMVVDGVSMSVPELLGAWLGNVVLNGSWLNMWYLYMLLGLYVMLPLYRLVTSHASDRTLVYLLVVYLVFQCVIPMLERILQIDVGFYIPVYTVYPLFLFLGYAIHAGKVRIPTPVAAVSLLVATVCLAVLTAAAASSDDKIALGALSTYTDILVVVQATAVFSLMRRTEGRMPKAPGSFLGMLDKSSFGIYLLHVLVIYVIYRAMDFNPFATGESMWVMLGLSVVVLAVSWALSWLLKKIPGVDKVL